MQNKSRTKPKVRFYDDLKEFLNSYFKNYDTITPNYDTKNLYKVNQNFYFRKRLNYKLYRISLNTKFLNIAIKRKNLINRMNKEELMLRLEKGDLKLYFEYDNVDELKEYLKTIDTTMSMSIVDKIENVVKLKSEQVENVEKTLNFNELEHIFVKHKKDEEIETDNKKSTQSWEKWHINFQELINYFGNKNILELSEDDFKDYRQTLKDKKLKNNTINEKMSYLKNFLDVAISKKLLNVNYVKNIKSLKVESKSNKKNFTKNELQALLENDKLEKIYKDILKILLYSGMRIGEFYLLEKSDILEEDGIKYIDIKEAKSEAGKREIPIHNEILSLIENFDFSYIQTRWTNPSFRANILNQIYKIVPKNEKKELNKTTHTLRGNFADELINKNPDKIAIAQEIIGHEKNANIKLTINTYAKGFSLKNKKDVIDTINYFN